MSYVQLYKAILVSRFCSMKDMSMKGVKCVDRDI